MAEIDWAEFARQTGGEVINPQDVAPVGISARQVRRGGRFGVQPDPTKDPNQSPRFAADVAARAAGSFAGFPMDTVQNATNLGIAGFGSIPNIVKNAVAGMPLPGGIGQKTADLIGTTVEPAWPKPDVLNFSEIPLLGPLKNIMPTSQNITKGFRQINSLTGSPEAGVPPVDKLQEFSGNVGEMAGGAMVGGVPKNAGAIARLVTSLVGAEAGRNAAVSMVPDSPLAQVAGTVLGGVVAPAALGGRIDAAKFAVGKGKELAGQASGKAVPVMEGIIGKRVKAATQGHPDAAANIDEATRLTQKFPGVKLSTAESAGAPALAEMQSRYANLSPANLNAEISRQEANLAALKQAMAERTPKAPGATPDTPMQSVGSTLSGKDANLAGRQAELTGSVASQSPQAIGTSLIDAANKERATVKTNVVAPAYKAAFDAAGDAKIDPTRVMKAGEEILGRKLSEFSPETAPLTVRALRNFEPKQDTPPKLTSRQEMGYDALPNIVVKKPEATLQQLDDVRKAINADIQRARESSGPMADSTLHNLRKLHDEISATIAESGLSPAAKTAYEKALGTYKTEYVPRFKEGIGANIFRKTSLNETRLNPDDVVRKFFQKGGESEAGSFVRLFGKNPEAMQAGKKGIEALYRSEVLDPVTRRISPEKHAKFMEEYRHPMDIMDKAGMGLRDRLSSIGDRAKSLADEGQKLDATAKYLKFDTATDMQSALLKSPQRMGAALREMNPEARAAFTKSILDEAWSKAESGGKTGGAQMSAYLKDNERTIKQAMESTQPKQVAARHYQDISDIAKMVEKIESVDIRGKLGTGTGNDPLKSATGVSIPTVWSQARAVMAGRQGTGTAIAMVAGPAITRLSQVQFDGVMNKALHDPATASALREYLRSAPANAEGRARGLLNVLDAAKDVATKLPGATAKFVLGTKNYKPNAELLAPEFARQGAETE